MLGILVKRIVLYGAGEGLKVASNYLNTSRSFEIVEVWDKKRKGDVYILGRRLPIVKPHKKDDIDYYVVTTVLYFEEIKKELTEKFGIDIKYIKKRNYLLEDVKKDLLDRYSECKNPDVISYCEYLKENDLSDYNFKINEKDVLLDTNVVYDENIGLFYCNWNGKKMYFKRSLNNERKVKNYLRSIIIEQMDQSPHCYRQKGFEVCRGDIVLDAGCAEGFFALDCIDIAKMIIIIECDNEWIEALRYTFRPYLNKVTIIDKKVGKVSNNSCVTIDELCAKYDISFVKMDIEGYEVDAILGAQNLLKRDSNSKFLVCTYHRRNDYEKLSQIFLSNCFNVEASRGYMVFTCENTQPEFRKGLLLASKNIFKDD